MNSARIGRAGQLRTVLLAALWGAMLAGSVVAADSLPEPPPTVRRLFVPEGQPRRWPPGDWRPWRLTDFERRLATLQPAPPQPDRAVISQAKYWGVLADGHLRGGRFELQVQRTGSEAVPLPLDPWNLPLINLNWKEGNSAALWGADPRGRTVLVVDRPTGTLVGTWALAGRKLPQGREFLLQFPSASVTHLELQLPTDRILQCSQGDVTGPVAATEPGWSLWQVELGSRNQAQVLITRRPSLPPAPGTAAAAPLPKPLVISRREMVCAVRQEVMRLQADFHLEVLETPIRELRFLASPDLKVIGVALGDNTPLTWTESAGPEGRQLKVALPDPLEGQGIVLRVQALATPLVQQNWALPQLRLADAVPIDGHITVNVAPPLELDDFQYPIDSYRQTALVTSPTDGESIVLRQLQPQGEARILLAWPRWKARCRMLTQVQATGREWTSATQFEWSAASGSAFSVRCALPPKWTVVDVREPENEPAGSVISWELLPPASGGGPTILRVEFREALSPEHPRQVRVLCRTPAAGLRESVAVPLFVPQGAQDVPIGDAESYLSIATEATASAVLESGDQVQVATAAELPGDPVAELFWRTAPAGSYPGGLLLKSRNANAHGQFLLQSARDLADVQASVQAVVSRQRIQETFRLRTTPRNAPLKRVLVYLSEASTDAEPMEWGLAGNTQQRLEAQRLDSAAHAGWNVPETGALWEVRLPSIAESEFTLVGKRTRTLKSQDRITLIHVPHANLFEGRVEVDHNPRLLLQFEPQNLEPIAELPDETARRPPGEETQRAAWRYRDLTAELECRVARDRETPAPLAIAEMDVSARLSLETEGTDLYWVSFRIGAVTESVTPGTPLRWTLPADAVLLRVTRDGTRIIPEQSGAQYLLYLADRRHAQLVQVQYRLPTTARFGPNYRTLALPETPHAVLRFNLKLLLPDTVRLDGRRSNLRFSEPSEQPETWRQTLFGPWARPAGTKPFNPLNLGDWSADWPLPGGTADESTPHDSVISEGNELSLPGESGNSGVGGMLPVGIVPGEAASRGWRVWHYTAPIPPREIQLVLWNRAGLWQLCWILLLFTLLVGALFRARTGRVSQEQLPNSAGGKWVTASVCLAVFLAACVPGVAFEMAASICLALLIVSLLPQSWLQRRAEASVSTPRVPGGSTRSFAQPTAITSLLVLVFVTCAAFAEERRSTAINANQFDVLIPVDLQGNPAGKNPLVYVPPTLHERLLQTVMDPQALPDSLLTSAEYLGVIDDQQPFTIKARFQVSVLARQPEVRVPFLFRGGNLGGEAACLVDGKPHPVLPNGNGEGCVLVLPGLGDETGTPAARPTSPTGEGITARRFTVEFRLHPQVTSRGTKEPVKVAEVGIPAVLSAVVTFSTSKAYPWLTVHESGGIVPTPLPPEKPGEPVRSLLGRATSLSWEWSEFPQPAVAAAELQWSFSTIVDVDPRLVQFRCQARGHILQGTLSSVRWPLPPGTAVRSLQANDLLEYHLEPRTDGGRDLWITFNRPRTSDFTIHAVLVDPVESREGTLTLPSLPVPECGDAPGASPRIDLYQIAIRPLADFRMDPPQAVHLNSLHEETAEAFQREQPSDGSRPIKKAWLLDKPQPLSLKLEVLRPRLDVSSLTIYRVLRDRINVTWEANIDTRTAPGFRYRLQVDPRLQISSISVMEEGVERLLRWNPTQTNQVLVFLNDRTTRGQKLLLEAHLPLAGPEKIQLPQLHLAYADVQQNRVSVYHDAGWNVRLENSSQFKTLPPDPAEQFPSGREVPQGRFELSPGTSLGAAVIEKNVPTVTTSRLFLLNTQEKPWKLSARLRMNVERGRGSEFEIIIPREWAPSSEFHSEPAGRHVSTTLADGSQQLLISPEEPIPAGAGCTVTLKLPVVPRTGLNWVLPEIRVPGSRAGSSFILTQSRGPAVKVSGQRFERLEAASLPPAVRALVPEPPTGTEWMWSSAGTAPVRLQFPTAAATSARLRRIILAETQVMPTAAGLQGRQLFWLPPESAEHLEFDWPEELELVSTLVDGNVVPLTHPQAGRLSIPLHPGPAGQTVLVAWKGPGIRASISEQALEMSKFWGTSGEVTIPLPKPRDAVLETELVEVLPSEKLRLRPDNNRPTASASTLALDRWEALLRWQAAQLTENVSDELIDATDQFIQQTAIDTERLLRRESSRVGESAKTRQRFDDLKKRTREFLPEAVASEFQRPSLVPQTALELPPTLTVCWSPSRVPQGTCRFVPTLEHGSSAEGSANAEDALSANAPLQILYATGGSFPWLLGVVAAALCGLVTSRLRRWRVFGAIQQRTWLACTVLGILWWQILLGGGWGFVVLMAGMLYGIVSWFRGPVASMTAPKELSGVHAHG